MHYWIEDYALESVPNAMDQARTSAANMLGGDKSYAAIPWFWSDQYELKLQMVGFSADGNREVRGAIWRLISSLSSI